MSQWSTNSVESSNTIYVYFNEYRKIFPNRILQKEVKRLKKKIFESYALKLIKFKIGSRILRLNKN
ncbi:hypothetical protein PGB90_002351 [Kerria lacca]